MSSSHNGLVTRFDQCSEGHLTINLYERLGFTKQQQRGILHLNGASSKGFPWLEHTMLLYLSISSLSNHGEGPGPQKMSRSDNVLLTDSDQFEPSLVIVFGPSSPASDLCVWLSNTFFYSLSVCPLLSGQYSCAACLPRQTVPCIDCKGVIGFLGDKHTNI